MKQLDKYKVILWDFDGVIMDSMSVRDLGFIKVLSEFPSEQVKELLVYHRLNGGLSRYVKFRYFFESIRGEYISDQRLMEYAIKFSEIMKTLLIDEKLLITDSVSFIKKNYQNYKFHIVSGSDGIELNYICRELNLSKLFITIDGSPTPKKELIRDTLKTYKYDKDEVCLIGDSINDKEAAEFNKIDFIGFNNDNLDCNVKIISFH